MLILTRYAGQSITIGDTVKIIILGRVGNQIKVGIEAPIEIAVDRTENIGKYRKIREDEKNKLSGGASEHD